LVKYQGWYNTYEGRKVNKVLCARSGPKKKRPMVSNEKKWIAMNPIFHQMKKLNPSNGQNNQLVHWWLLVHFGPMQCTPKKHTTPNPIGRLNMPSKCLDYYFISFAPNMFP
jgi:hypothetical protein